MSHPLNNDTINSALESKRHVLFNQSTQNGRFYKYISGDKLVYDYYILRDPSAPIGSTFEYAQMYFKDGVVYITSPFINMGEVIAGYMNVSGLHAFESSTFDKQVKILSGGLQVTGNTTFNGSMLVSNNLRLGGNLDVTGNATFKSGIYVQDALVMSSIFSISHSGDTLKIISINETGIIDLGSDDRTKIINIGCTNRSIEQINIGVGLHSPGDPATIINIGSPGDIVNINASANIVNVFDYQIINKHFIINGISGGTLIPIDVSNVGIGFSNGVDNFAGYLLTDGVTGNFFQLKAPNNNYVLDFPVLTGNAKVIYEDTLSQTTRMNNLYATFDSNINNGLFRNNLTVNNRLDVSGSTSFNSDVEIRGNTLLRNNLGVEGLVGINGDIIHNGTFNNLGNIIQTGDVSIAGNVFVVGNTTFTNANVSIDQTLRVGSGMIVTGNATFNNSNITLDNTLYTNNLNVTSVAQIGNGLKVAGGAVITGDVNINNSTVNINGNMNVTGSTNFFGAQMNVNSNLFVNGTTTFTKNVLVSGTSTLLDTVYANNDLLVSGGIQVSGSSSFSNGVYVNNYLNISGRGVTVTGNTTMSRNLYIGNNLNIEGQMIVTGGAQFMNDTLFYGNVQIFNKLAVTGDSTFNNSVLIQQNVGAYGIGVTGNATFNNTIFTVSGDLNLGGALIITGTAILNGFDLANVSKGINVSGNVTFTDTILTISGSVIIEGGGLSVSGNTTFINTNMFVSGAMAISGSGLNVTGDSNLIGQVTTSGLIVNNNTTLNTLTVTSTIINADLTTTSLYVSNNTIMNGSLTVSGDSAFSSNVSVSGLNVSNNVIINNGLTVRGASVQNLLVVSGFYADNNVQVSGSVSVSGNLSVSGYTIFNSAGVFGNGLLVSGGMLLTGDLHANNHMYVSGLVAISGEGLRVTGQTILNNSLIINSKFRHINATFSESDRISSINQQYCSLDVSPDGLWSGFVYRFENAGGGTYLGLLSVNNINVTYNSSFPQFQESYPGYVSLTGNFDDLRMNYTPDSKGVYLYYLFDGNYYTKYFSEYNDILKWQPFIQTGIGLTFNEYGPFDINFYPDVPPTIFSKSSTYTNASILPSKSTVQVKLNYTGLYLSGNAYLDSENITLSGTVMVTGGGLIVDTKTTFANDVSISGGLSVNGLNISGNTTFEGKISLSGDILITGNSVNIGTVNIAAANIGILTTDSVAVGNPIFTNPVRFYSGLLEVGDIIPGPGNQLQIAISAPGGKLSLGDDSNVAEISMGIGNQPKNIYIGANSDIVYINGTLRMAQEGAATNVSNLNVSSKYFTVNAPATLGTGIPVNAAGLQISDGVTLAAGYFLTDRSIGDRFVMKAPRAPSGQTFSYELSFPVITTTSTVLIKDDLTKTLRIENINVSQAATFNNYLKLNGTIDIQGTNHSISGVSNFNTINVNNQANIFNAVVNNNLTVAKNVNFSNSLVSVSGQMNISGRGLVLTGAATFSNIGVGSKGSLANLEVLSKATFNNDVTVIGNNRVFSGSLIVQDGGIFVTAGLGGGKSVTFQSTVDVEGKLNVTGGLTVTGNSTFTNIYVSQNAVINNLTILNNMLFGPSNTISGSLLISGALVVTGGASFETIHVATTGNIQTLFVDSMLVTNNATFRSNIDVLGGLTISGGIYATGNNVFSNISVVNTSTFNNGVFVSGNAVLGNTNNSSIATVNGKLHISGIGMVVTGSSVLQSVIVGENTQLNTLFVSGNTVFQNSSVEVSGSVNINGALVVTGSATLNKAYVSNLVVDNVNVGNNASLLNGLNVEGNVTFDNSILSVSGGLYISKMATFNDISIQNDLSVQAGLVIGQSSTFYGPENYFDGNATVNGFAAFNDSIYVQNTSEFNGVVTVNNSIEVGGIGEIVTDNVNKFQLNTLNPESTIDIGADMNTTNIIIGPQNGDAKTITIGGDNNDINLVGNINYIGTINATDLTIVNGTVNDKKIILNTGGGGNLDVYDVGLAFSDGTENERGYIKTDTVHGDHFVFKAPYNTQFELSTPVLNTTSTIAVIDDATSTLSINNLNVVGSVTFSGDVTLQSLTVEQMTDLNNVIINGSTTFTNADIYIQGNENIEGSLIVTGVAIIDNLNVDSGAINNLYVANNATFDNSNVYVNGQLNISGGISVSGTSVFNNLAINSSDLIKLNVLGNATFLNSISVSGGINAFSGGSTFGNVRIFNLTANNLLVTTSSTFNNRITVSGGIDAFTGNATFGNVTIGNRLVVSGLSTFNNNVSISGLLNISGGIVVTGTSILGNLVINSSDLNTINVLGNATFSNSIVSVSGILNVSGRGLTVTGSTTLGNANIANANVNVLNVTSLATFNNGLSISGNVTMLNGTIVTSRLLVSGNVTFSNLVVTNNFLSLGRATFTNAFAQNLNVNNGLYVTNNVTFNNTILSVSGNAFVNNKRVVTIDELEDTNIDVHLYQLDNVPVLMPTITGNHLFLINNTILSTITGAYGGVTGLAYSIVADQDYDLVYVGGSFVGAGGLDITGIAVFDTYNKVWSALGDGVDGTVYSIAKDGDAFYIGGSFVQAHDITVNGFVSYDRSNDSWTDLGGVDGTVLAQALDSTKLLYVGGSFVSAESVVTNGIVVYDTTSGTWSDLGAGINGTVNTIAVDSNDLVYVGGSFIQAGSIATKGIAVWNKNTLSWTSLGSGVNGTVNSIAIDSNNIVYVGGTFTQAGSINRDGIAIWDQTEEEWSGFTNEIHGTINTIKLDALENVFIGGSFNYNDTPTTLVSENIMYWDKESMEWTRSNLDGIYGVKGNVLTLEFDKKNDAYASIDDLTQAGVIIDLNSFLQISCNLTKPIYFNGPLRSLDSSGNLTITKQVIFTRLGEYLNVYYNANSDTGLSLQRSITGFNTIYVSGNGVFNNSLVTISGGLNIDGTGLMVTGDVTIIGNLNVDGAQGLSSLEVQNFSTFGDNVFMNNDLLVSGGLYVSGTSTLDNDLSISGSMYLVGTEVIITADTSIYGELYVENYVNIENDVTITGDLYQDGMLMISGSMEISGDGLTVTGDAIFDESDFSISGSLMVTGNAIFDESDFSISGSLMVTGDAIFDECDLTISGSLSVTGDLEVNDGEVSFLGTNLLLNNAFATFNNVHLYMNGLFSQTGGMIITGDATFSSHLTLGNGLEVEDGGLNVVGDTVLEGDLDVEGDTAIVGDVSIDGTMIVTGDQYIVGNIFISGNFSVSGIANINGLDLSSFDNGLNVSGNVTFFNGRVNISGSGLTVTGNATFSNSLSVYGDAHFNNNSTQIITVADVPINTSIVLNSLNTTLDTQRRKITVTAGAVQWNSFYSGFTGNSSGIYTIQVDSTSTNVYFHSDANIYRYNTNTGVTTLIGVITSGFIGCFVVCPFTGRLFIGSLWQVVYNGVTYNTKGCGYFNGSTWTSIFGSGSGLSGGNIFNIIPINSTQIYLGGGFTSLNDDYNNYKLIIWDYSTFSRINDLNMMTYFGGYDGGTVFAPSVMITSEKTEGTFPPIAGTIAYIESGGVTTGATSTVTGQASYFNGVYELKASSNNHIVGRLVDKVTNNTSAHWEPDNFWAWWLNTYYGSISTPVVGMGNVLGEWFQVKYPIAIVPKSYTFYNGWTYLSSVIQWTLVASNDEITWTPLHDATDWGQASEYQARTYGVSTSNSYTYYRFIIRGIYDSNNQLPRIAEFTVQGATAGMTPTTFTRMVTYASYYYGSYDGNSIYDPSTNAWTSYAPSGLIFYRMIPYYSSPDSYLFVMTYGASTTNFYRINVIDSNISNHSVTLIATFNNTTTLFRLKGSTIYFAGNFTTVTQGANTINCQRTISYSIPSNTFTTISPTTVSGTINSLDVAPTNDNLYIGGTFSIPSLSISNLAFYGNHNYASITIPSTTILASGVTYSSYSFTRSDIGQSYFLTNNASTNVSTLGTFDNSVFRSNLNITGNINALGNVSVTGNVLLNDTLGITNIGLINQTGNLIISGRGNVGINMTAPAYTLDIGGDVRARTLYFTGGGTLSSTGGIIYADSSIGCIIRSATINPSTAHFDLRNGSNTSLFRILSNGNVGIGTTNPGANLDVKDIMIIRNTATDTVGGFNTTISGGFLSIEAYNQANTVKKNIALAAYGGFVGIGKTNPAYTLDIQGDLRVSGGIISAGSNSDTQLNYSLTDITIPTTVNNYVEFARFVSNSSAFTINMNVAVSNVNFSLTKKYIIPIQYNCATTRVVVLPIASTGNWNGSSDFEILLVVSAGTATLRLRRTLGTQVGNAGINMIIECDNDDKPVFTQLNNTGTDSTVYNIFGYTPLTQVGNTGRVGVGTTNPTSELSIFGPSNYCLDINSDGNSNILFNTPQSNGSIALKGWTGDPTDVAFDFYNGTSSGVTNSTPLYYFRNNANTRLMVINYGGNVGIGSTNPTTILDLASSNTPINATHTGAGAPGFTNALTSYKSTMSSGENYILRLGNSTSSNCNGYIGFNLISAGTFTASNFPPVAMSANTSTITGQSYGNGTYVSSSSTNGTLAFRAFNKVTNTSSSHWENDSQNYNFSYFGTQSTTLSGVGTYSGEWLQIQMPVSVILKSYTIVNAWDNNSNPAAWNIAGSNDGTTWFSLDSRTSQTPSSAYQTRTYNVTGITTGYTYFRITVSAINSSYNFVRINELIINGDNAFSPNSNFVTMGLQGADNLLNINAAGNVGIGTTSLDSNSKVTIKNGNTSTGTTLNQLVFNLNTGSSNYPHAVKTRHNGAAASGNAIDFYTWNFGTDAANTVGTRHTMTLESGNVGIGTTAPPWKFSVFAGDVPIYANFTGAAVANAFPCSILCLKPLMGTGETHMISVGQADSAYNRAYLGFRYQSSGSTSNALTLGLHSANSLVNILGNGNVGIGTTSPSAPLHIFTTAAADSIENVLSHAVGDSNFWLVTKKGDAPNVVGGIFHRFGLYYSYSGRNNAMIRFHRGFNEFGGFMSFSTNFDNERMRIDSDGNVGIGTNAPQSLLDVYSPATNSVILLRNDTSVIRTIALNGQNYIQSGAANTADSKANLHFTSIQANTYFMTILGSNGYVGIGTSNPSLHHHINGSVNGDLGQIIQNSFTSSGSNATSIIRLRNNNNDDLVIFKNNTQRVSEGGGNTATIRNNNGNLRLQAVSGTNGNIGLSIVPFANGISYVGISNDNPVADLHFSDAAADLRPAAGWSTVNNSDSKILFYNNSSSNWCGMGVDSGGYWWLRTGTATQNVLILDPAGNLGIGTTSPGAKLDVNGNLLIRAFTPGSENGIFFRESFVTSNKYNCSIMTYDHSGDTFADGISINGYDGVSFCVGSNTRNEKVRINASGNVGIGTTNPANLLHIFSAGSGGIALSRYENGLALFTTGVTNNRFQVYNGSSVGVYLTSGGTSWTATSDLRVKKNIEIINNPLEKLMGLRAIKFNWKVEDDSEVKTLGLVAQEVKEVFPEAISTSSHEEYGEVYGIQYTELIPPMIGAIQELNNKVSTVQNMDTSKLLEQSNLQQIEIVQLKEQLQTTQKLLEDKDTMIKSLSDQLITSDAKVSALTEKMNKLISILGLEL